MASSVDFHERPFDEGTLTKLHLLELYARAWLPVFLARDVPTHSEIHVFDFFASPGTDLAGEPGSPLRLLRQLDAMRKLPGWPQVRVNAHFSDADGRKIASLERRVADLGAAVSDITVSVQALAFEAAFANCQAILQRRNAAKLLVIDQCGVSHVTPEVFASLVKAPTTDFLFFISSSTLSRFRDHPAIKQKIQRPEDHYHVHRAAADYYRSLLPAGSSYNLAHFSIKKGPNIYGLIFGSGHPLGIAKFLDVAWAEDEVNGEADFDIHRDNIIPGQARLFEPTKVGVFEDELEALLRAGAIGDEQGVIAVCFRHGVRPQHAEKVLERLKNEGVLDMDFRVPQVRNYKTPRSIRRGRR